MIYRFTICEYGGGETASCTLSCAEDFAAGFEASAKMLIDDETHYMIREEIGDHDATAELAVFDPWAEAV